MDKSELIRIASEHIRSLVDIDTTESMKNSERGIARKLKIHKNTVKKYLQNEVVRPHHDSLFNILSSKLGSKEAALAMKSSFPGWYAKLGKKFAEDGAFANKSYFEFDNVSLVILNEAIKDLGVSDKWISQKFGELGLEVRDNLIKDQFLKHNNDGTNEILYDKMELLDNETVHSLMSIKLENISMDKLGKNASIYTNGRSVSKECQSSLKKIFVNCIRDCETKIEEDQASGKKMTEFFDLNVFASWSNNSEREV